MSLRTLSITTLVTSSLWLGGCTTLDQATTSFSCLLNTSQPGCAAAPATDTPPDSAAPAPADRFVQLQSVLDRETEQARQAQAQAVHAMRQLPPALRAVAGAVQIQPVHIEDSQQPGNSHTVNALDSVSIDLPLAAKGRREYTQAMDVLKALANTLADNRGAATISVQQAAADVQARRVNTATGTTQSPQGNPVSVHKQTSTTLPAGVERYTIRAGAIRGKL